MVQARLTRISTLPEYGTFGALTIDGIPFCITLEPYKRDNAEDVSCIPTGMYECKRFESPKFGETFRISRVQGRTKILFHSGNEDEDTDGCIILARNFGKIGKNPAVLSSRSVFQSFLGHMDGEDKFILTIQEAY